MLLALLLACASDPDRDGFAGEDDCAAHSGDVHPGAHEVCNGIDDDCDGSVDETYDLDGDGVLADEADCRALGVEVDCDDTDATVFPGAQEVCDGRDEDCSGAADDVGDEDGDGSGACEDCDDDDPFVYPGAVEACDGVDNDCTGAADEAWDDDGDGVSACGGDCDEGDPDRSPANPEVCDAVDNDCDDEVDEGFDADGDGVATCFGDCDDADPATYTGAVEACDGVDNDCDPLTVEDIDEDQDGWTLCEGDCDDAAAGANPDAAEACNGLDDDCDGETDEDVACWGCVDVPEGMVCATPTGWDTASGVCAAVGMSLVRIDSSEENATLADRASAYAATAFWIGLNDVASEGSWVWEDGAAPVFTQWYSGEPNNSGNEDCAASNFGAIGSWNDYPCTQELAFFCEP